MQRPSGWSWPHSQKNWTQLAAFHAAGDAAPEEPPMSPDEEEALSCGHNAVDSAVLLAGSPANTSDVHPLPSLDGQLQLF